MTFLYKKCDIIQIGGDKLSYRIMTVYMATRNDYTIVRKMPSGKGYADIVFQIF